MVTRGMIQCSAAVKLWNLGDEEEDPGALKHKTRAEVGTWLMGWINVSHSKGPSLVLVESSDFFTISTLLHGVTWSDPHKSQDQLEPCLVSLEPS